MGTTITILSVLMIFMAIFLVVAVLMQSGKDSRLSGTIAGGAETFFGKTMARPSTESCPRRLPWLPSSS